MKKKTSRQERASERREKHKKVLAAVEERRSDETHRPDPIESRLLDGEAVEIVGPADAPTASQTHRFRGLVGTALPPYVASSESPHAGKTMRPVKVNGKVVGIPEDRLRSVDRRTSGPTHTSTPMYRKVWNRVFGGERDTA